MSARPPHESTVCAVVHAVGREEETAAAVDAIRGQSHEVDELMIQAPGRPAPASPAAWLWLVAGSVAPEPEALAQLLEPLERWAPLPPPALLASKVVRPDGCPEPASLPIPRMGDQRDLVVAGFERHVLPIRVARAGSLLVRAQTLARLGLRAEGPASPGRDLVWSARLLKHELGVLVPASVAIHRPLSHEAARRRARRELLASLRLLLGGSLRAGEKPMFAFRLADAGLQRLRKAG